MIFHFHLDRMVKCRVRTRIVVLETDHHHRPSRIPPATTLGIYFGCVYFRISHRKTIPGASDGLGRLALRVVLYCDWRIGHSTRWSAIPDTPLSQKYYVADQRVTRSHQDNTNQISALAASSTFEFFFFGIYGRAVHMGEINNRGVINQL